jgi:hypothetical protein
MVEKHFVFIKNNRVMNSAVFDSQNEELADSIAHEQGYDDAVWIGEDPVPHKWAEYDPTTNTFSGPTVEYLFENGIIAHLPIFENNE